MRSPLSLLSSKLDKLKFSSRSSQDMPSSPSTSSVALLWMHSVKLWGPELHKVFQVRPHHRWRQRDGHLFRPAGCAVFDAPQAAVCGLGCQGTLLAPAEPAANQHPQVPCCRADLQPLLSPFVLVPDSKAPCLTD